MRRNSKSPEEAATIGGSIRRDRKRLGLVLEDVEDATGVNVGQLSRFERGDFKIESPNLQKVRQFLRDEAGKSQGDPMLVARFSSFLERSPRHEAAAAAIVAALEALV